jgi:hypothetical protein
MSTNGKTECTWSHPWEGEDPVSSAWERRPDSFRRELLQRDGQWLIKSTCRYCGAVLVGSALGTLPRDEDRHCEQCPSLKQNQRPKQNPELPDKIA